MRLTINIWNSNSFDYYARMITHVTVKLFHFRRRAVRIGAWLSWAELRRTQIHPHSLLLIYYRIHSGDKSSLPPNFASLWSTLVPHYIPNVPPKKEDEVASERLLFWELSLIINLQHHLYFLPLENSPSSRVMHNCPDNVIYLDIYKSPYIQMEMPSNLSFLYREHEMEMFSEDCTNYHYTNCASN